MSAKSEMQITVKIRSQYFVVPVSHEDTVRQLACSAISRYRDFCIQCRNKSVSQSDEAASDSRSVDCYLFLPEVFVVRRQRDQTILPNDDRASVLLSDGEYVILECDLEAKISGAYGELRMYEDDTEFKYCLKNAEALEIDGNHMTPEHLVELGKGLYRLKLSDDARRRVSEARDVVEELIANDKVAYGINTGFGMFANTVIEKSKLTKLQVYLIRSHAAGVGKGIGLKATRMLFALRLNVLAKGFSGISLQTLEHMIEIYNTSCLPWVPEQGSVGASGDLAPLAHLALGLIGEGLMWSPLTGWAPSCEVLYVNGLKPLELKPKEGLCLINGTQLMTSIGAEACVWADRIVKQADVVASLTLDVLKGTNSATDPDVGRVRPHKGQIYSARRMRALLSNECYRSDLADSHRDCSKVQDAYTLRCCPQVHGIVYDTIAFVRNIISTELNSATDNPLVFTNRQRIVSAGNFHGEYPAKALDYLAIGVHELACISERRIERLVNPVHSQLPAFLTEDGGLNSGFMVAHVTAASLVSENKVLCHPSSVDSISTSAAQEDHVSMGAFSARKCLQVLRNVETVLAIELLAASQALDFLRPLKSTKPLEMVYGLIRHVIPRLQNDRFMAPEIAAVASLLRAGRINDTVDTYVEEYYAKSAADRLF